MRNEKQRLHRAADEMTELIKAHVSDKPEDVDVYEAMCARDDLRQIAEEVSYENDNSPEFCHELQVGDFANDAHEPTPSPEKNVVKVVELTETPANEYETGDGKTVAEYDTNKFYDEESPVVKGVYPNMSSEKVWAFPEERLEQL